ncbi:hypothetical protein RRG08_034595 [Elysia crispata]|uniref:Uncharacterized protein n=1 Tax=Elysia crispata TaxID=231223 RepID=A0AAE1B288_9GAST|nr:hypothetical protein RRG08_034595 [Elysia crispata]
MSQHLSLGHGAHLIYNYHLSFREWGVTLEDANCIPIVQLNFFPGTRISECYGSSGDRFYSCASRTSSVEMERRGPVGLMRHSSIANVEKLSESERKCQRKRK